MAVRVGILGAKHGTDFKHTFQVAQNGHLLVQLR
jgi:hypothetical protein